MRDACECLRFVAEGRSGRRLNIFRRWRELFTPDLGVVWRERRYHHCTSLNRLLRAVLVATGRFPEDAIRTRWSCILLVFPHQYLRVRVNGRWVALDPWSYNFGIRFGDHAKGFHIGSWRPSDDRIS